MTRVLLPPLQDLERMKGSIMDASESTQYFSSVRVLCFAQSLTQARVRFYAVSDAIEGAEVMLYGVTLRYKESANVSQAAV